jgi:hypothetical protein
MGGRPDGPLVLRRPLGPPIPEAFVMTPDAPRQKPYTVSFENFPVTVTVAPGQLSSVGECDGVVTIQLRNGSRIDVGPFASPEEAEALVTRVVNADDRARDLRPTPATKGEYLQALRRNAWTFPYVGSEMGVPPADWVADAWELPAVRDSIYGGGICREYLKGNGLCCTKEFLAVLAASLRTEQVVRLYEDIRDAQPEREPEFRDDFLVAFAAHAHALPPAGATTRRAPRPGRSASAWVEFDDEGEDGISF